jgi:hypothetical protein
MASNRYRRTAEVERKFVRQELAQGWLWFVAQVIFLALSAALGVLAIVHALEAAEWHLTAGAGGGSMFFAGLTAAVRKKPK